MSKRRYYNPWAVCNAKAKEYGWDKTKKEHCIQGVKETNAINKRKRKR